MIHGQYDPFLVATSIAIAVYASYTALDMGNRVAATQGRVRAAWLAGGSIAMGTGIWSMHFVGMLAWDVPGITMAHDVTLLLLSALVAIAGSGLALAVVASQRDSTAALPSASLAMGAAISGMHYLGIAGMRMAARLTWNVPLVAASVGIAVATAFVALRLTLRFRSRPHDHGPRMVAGCVMGAAIAGMHYTAMAAMSLTPAPMPMAIGEEHVLATGGLAVSVAVGAVLILTMSLIASSSQRALERQATVAAMNARLFRDAEARAGEEEALRRATEEVASAMTTAEVASRIAWSAIEATGSDGAIVEILDSGGPARASAFMPGRAVAESVIVSSPVSHRISSRRDPLVAANEMDVAALLGGYPPFGDSALPSSAIGIPLRDGDTTIGTMVLWRAGGRPPFSSGDRSHASTFGHLASLGFRRAKMLEESERRRVESERSERMAGLGRVASAIAHEFNNVLMSLQAFHEVTLRAGTYDQFLRNAPQVEEAIRRGRNVSTDLLRLTGASQPSLGRLDLCRWFGEIRGRLEQIAGGSIALEIACPDGLAVRADPSHLEQVMVNLAQNAREAMPDGGRMAVTARQHDLDPDVVEIVVRDDGRGMAEAVAQRAFEPLFSTKEGKRGLGLAIAHEVARAHGGSIAIESAPGRGATVRLSLRRAEAAPEQREAGRGPRQLRRVVMVEDDDLVAGGLSMILEMSDIAVERVALGAAALPAVRAFRPDAVILDIGLPDIDGMTVYRRIREESEVPVVFATGHGDESVLAGIVNQPHVAFLRKPFEGDELIAALESVIAVR
ncbi:MAG TPA: MHYT domain-containing protein [Thermoanaerobaculia bacterium]|nr:MHYT domain-containing protein [Thermoanaerobaculia bacterium]